MNTTTEQLRENRGRVTNPSPQKYVNAMSGRLILRRAFIASVPVMTGYLVLGFGFGVLFTKAGFNPWLAVAMSVFVYTGALQFLAVGLLSAGASIATIALSALMVNTRHIFYGISFLNKYRGAGRLKPYLIFALTDETFSLLVQTPKDLRGKPERFRYFFALTLLNQSYWVLGTIVGALAGSFLHFNSKGIDFALTALFLCIVADQWLSAQNWLQRVPAIIGVVVSVYCLLIIGPNHFLLPTMLAMVVVLLVTRSSLVRVHEVPSGSGTPSENPAGRGSGGNAAESRLAPHETEPRKEEHDV